jgi:CMP-N-acetylneuraminic acid synthetase
MKINAVVPIRYQDCFNVEDSPKFFLREKILWEYTFEQIIREADVLDQVIVAYDDKRFEPYIADYLEHPKFLGYCRPPFLSKQNISILNVLAHVNTWAQSSGNASDYLMLLEITHPLRPQGIIQQVANTMRENPVDSLVTVHPVHYNFWRQGENGPIARMQGHGDNSKIDMYQEIAGICSLFRQELLETDTPFGEEIDMVPIQEFWATIDARDEEGLWLAEAYLKKIKK